MITYICTEGANAYAPWPSKSHRSRFRLINHYFVTCMCVLVSGTNGSMQVDMTRRSHHSNVRRLSHHGRRGASSVAPAASSTSTHIDRLQRSFNQRPHRHAGTPSSAPPIHGHQLHRHEDRLHRLAGKAARTPTTLTRCHSSTPSDYASRVTRPRHIKPPWAHAHLRHYKIYIAKFIRHRHQATMPRVDV